MLRLNARWTRRLDAYRLIHQHPVNRGCHLFGIPLVFASVVLAPIMGPWAAAAVFVTGWGLQFFGHFVEGQKPSILGDPRFFVMGGVWWLQRVGVPVAETREDPSDLDGALGGMAPSQRPPVPAPRDVRNSL